MSHPGAQGKPDPHESAILHVQGAAPYTDDLIEPAGTLHGAFALADCAHGLLRSLDTTAASAVHGVVAILRAADIPGANNCGPSQPGDPILADGLIEFHGQALCLVLAETRQAARYAASLVKADIELLPAILTVEEAIAAESWVLPPVEVSRGDWQASLQNSTYHLSGSGEVGGQEHFYLEGQVALALPREGRSIHLHSSTQHPTEMQHLVAHMLGWQSHQVSVECRRMGGGFGGKESQSGQCACAAALAAWKLGRPVKIRLDRDDDMVMTGKRHDFHFNYQVGFDPDGRIRALDITLASRCGYSADLSGPINDRAIFHIDNCYFLETVRVRSLRCKTNTVSNTAFRGFGGPQGMYAIETIIDAIATTLGRDALEIRQLNLYGPSSGTERSSTHYGQKIEDNVAPAIIEQLIGSSNYYQRRAQIDQWNAANPIIKKGLALVPVKFGISFTATFYNQAGAIVYVYADGSVLVTHGGTEMGQGLYTKIRQIVADALGVAPSQVRFTPTDTSRIPNTSATAASSGTDLNGQAAQIAASAIRERLAAFWAARHQVEPAAVSFDCGKVTVGSQTSSFAEVCAAAYMDRIKLWESGFYRTPKIHYDKASMQGRPFFYFAYGAACAEVALDTLTGENRLLRVDILHDVGRSINPGIDRGQIEGGFIQGMGWLTTEELWWQPEGAQRGRLMTHAPSSYKIPATSDCPPIFQVDFFQNENVEDSVYRSKAVGEPPLMLALSVFSALRDAVAAAGGNPATLTAPATTETLLRAVSGPL